MINANEVFDKLMGIACDVEDVASDVAEFATDAPDEETKRKIEVLSEVLSFIQQDLRVNAETAKEIWK